MTDATAHSYVDQYAPPGLSTATVPADTKSGVAPIAAATGATQSTSPTTSAQSQDLADQNIFHLLGVTSANDTEKEAFLDELQQVIWEDFLENDVDLLLTDEEKIELKKITDGKDNNDVAQQEAIVAFLEKLVPDLEEIMLEKAMELKADMVRERLAGMKEFFANQPDKLQTLSQADALLADEQWYDLAELLNKQSA